MLRYFREALTKLNPWINDTQIVEAQELKRKLKWMQETEMAVVISQEQNEIQTFKK